MRTKGSLFLSLLFLLCIPGRSDASLIAWYSFDASNATDGSGFGNTGSVGSAVAFSGDVASALGAGNSAVFNGTNNSTGLITVPNSPSLQSIKDTLTVSFWIKMDHTANPTWIRVMRKGSEANPSEGWMVTRNSGNSDLLMRTDTIGAGGAFNQNRGQGVGVGMLDGTWHHYTHVRDNGTWTEYVDGIQTGSGSYPHGNGFSNTQPLLVGGRVNQNMIGSLDEVAIFDQALNSHQIRSLALGIVDPVQAAVLVPEPSSSLVLLFLGTVLTAFRRSRRKVAGRS